MQLIVHPVIWRMQLLLTQIAKPELLQMHSPHDGTVLDRKFATYKLMISLNLNNGSQHSCALALPSNANELIVFNCNGSMCKLYIPKPYSSSTSSGKCKNRVRLIHPFTLNRIAQSRLYATDLCAINFCTL